MPLFRHAFAHATRLPLIDIWLCLKRTFIKIKYDQILKERVKLDPMPWVDLTLYRTNIHTPDTILNITPILNIRWKDVNQTPVSASVTCSGWELGRFSQCVSQLDKYLGLLHCQTHSTHQEKIAKYCSVARYVYHYDIDKHTAKWKPGRFYRKRTDRVQNILRYISS